MGCGNSIWLISMDWISGVYIQMLTEGYMYNGRLRVDLIG